MSHIDFSTVVTQYIRMMGYATIVLCSFYALKLKRYKTILLYGDFIVSMVGLVSIFLIHSDLNVSFIAGTAFTVAVFLWMIVHLINIFNS